MSGTDSAASSPYRRDNHFGKTTEDERPSGHEECTGTDPAEYIAFQLLLELTEPICARTKHAPAWNGGQLAECFAWLLDGETIDGRGDQLHHKQGEQPLSEPALHLPKQTERNGRIINYGQFPNRRRYSEDGYVNWGETTATEVPEVGFGTWMQAVHNYLATREHNGELTLTNKEQYLSQAKGLFYDQNLNSHKALEVFVRNVRQEEDPET